MLSQEEASLRFSSASFAVASSPGSNRSCGIIMLARPSCLLVNSWSDQDGRFLMCEFSCRSKMFRVATVYAPNRNPECNEFFDLVSSKMNVTVPTILCGDFNCVLDRSVDRRGSAHDDYSRESVWALTLLFDAATVTDIWRYLHPVSSSFTWSRWDGTAASRIDLMGVPMPGSLMCHPPKSSRVLSLTIVPSLWVSPFRRRPLWGKVFGNLTFPS